MTRIYGYHGYTLVVAENEESLNARHVLASMVANHSDDPKAVGLALD